MTKRLIPAHEIRARLELDSKTATKALKRVLKQASGGPAVCSFLKQVVQEQVPTLVYGDYDADGITATFLLHRWLRTQGVPGNCFLPSRHKHGYGLDSEIVTQAVDQGYQALIALDCGTANLAEIKMAKTAGLMVAVVDHHQPKAELPDVPLLNPSISPELPPLCTAGLVYALLLSRIADEFGEFVGDELELAGLATLADVVPLEPYNWWLAHEALKRLPESVNYGVSELVKATRLHGLSRLTARQALFNLVPRLNAAGRMRSPRLALELLNANDQDEARQAAQQLELLNTERKRVATQIEQQALLAATNYTAVSALALYDPQWHIGILGLVAARVAEQLRKPVVMFADTPGEQELLSGSARSAAGVDIIAALQQCEATVVSYGGHREAAGLKVSLHELDSFRAAWEAAVAAAPLPEIPAELELLEVAISELTAEFETDMWRLAPFGPGYPAPQCVLDGCRVVRSSYMGREKTHMSVIVTDGACELRLVGFNLSHLVRQLTPGQEIRPVVEIEPDNWNNRCTIALRIIKLVE